MDNDNSTPLSEEEAVEVEEDSIVGARDERGWVVTGYGGCIILSNWIVSPLMSNHNQ